MIETYRGLRLKSVKLSERERDRSLVSSLKGHVLLVLV